MTIPGAAVMLRHLTCACALFALALLLCLSTHSAAADRPPNVVFLIADDLRADVLGAYGSKQCRTPNLDKLAAEGMVFTRAVCPFPLCVPSRAEILTGCSSLRVPALAGGKLDPALVTWPAAMKEAGYRTVYIGKWHTQGRPSQHGYSETRGLYSGGGHLWQEQTDHNGHPVTGYCGWVFQSEDGKTIEPEKGIGLTPDISRLFADAAIGLIEEKRDQPFFLHVNFTAPHDPLHMPPGYANKYDPRQIVLPRNFAAEHPFDHGNLKGRDELLLPFPRTKTDVQDELAVYYAVVEHLDEQIGRVVAALKSSGQWDDTILIFTADHGLAIGSHGLRGKQNMYEHTIGVPLIVRGPGIRAGKRLAAPIYLRDMYPTVCELAGVPIPKTVEAKSQAAVIRGKADRVHDEIYTYFMNFQRAIRTDRWKLIHYPHLSRDQLFDLASDPDELHDLAADPQQAATLAALKEKLQKWRVSVNDGALAGQDSVVAEGEKPKLLAERGAGEGPAWHPDLGLLTSGEGHIMRRSRDGEVSIYLKDAGSNGLLFDHQGRLVYCDAERRRVVRREPDGKLSVLAERYEGKRYNQPNDLTIDSKGRIYFSDPCYGDRSRMEMADTAGRKIEGVYRIDPDGRVSRIITHEVDRPNGLVVTPDDRTLFVADNNNDTVGGARKLWRFELKADGTVDFASQKLIHDWGKTRGPDGMKLDAKGRLFVAAGLNRPNPPVETQDKPTAGIYVFSPEDKLLEFIPIPRDECTNCAFGGDDLKTLFVTAGGTLWSIRMKERGLLAWPR